VIFFVFDANALIGPIDVSACGMLDIKCMMSVQKSDKCLKWSLISLEDSVCTAIY